MPKTAAIKQPNKQHKTLERTNKSAAKNSDNKLWKSF